MWHCWIYRTADATPIILNGLKRLEYRGYDSAGLAVLQDSRIEVRRDAGKLARLASLVRQNLRYMVTWASAIHGGRRMVSPALATPIPTWV